MEGIKPHTSLLSFNLHLDDNKLGDNEENLRFLADGLKPLTALQTFSLNLQQNKLGTNP